MSSPIGESLARDLGNLAGRVFVEYTERGGDAASVAAALQVAAVEGARLGVKAAALEAELAARRDGRHLLIDVSGCTLDPGLPWSEWAQRLEALDD